LLILSSCIDAGASYMSVTKVKHTKDICYYVLCWWDYWVRV